MFHSIVIADDRLAVRTELRRLLEDELDLYIAGEINESGYIVELTKSIQPDILIMNVRMTGIDFEETIRQVCTSSRHTHVILLAPSQEDLYARSAIRSGAAAYVLRESSLSEMVKAVRAVISGYRYLGSPFYDRALETYIHEKRCFSPDPSQMLDFEFQNFYT
jgi:two-component system invasion response regulator UvrY